jgi:hypothetical protein
MLVEISPQPKITCGKQTIKLSPKKQNVNRKIEKDFISYICFLYLLVGKNTGLIDFIFEITNFAQYICINI